MRAVPVDRYRLAKAVGVVAIAASALSQEYGSGINFVLVNSLGQYPRVTWLVPYAMIAAGILLLPKVVLFMRFSQVAPRAGSTYVWLTRSLNLPLGFIIAFLWFIGTCGAAGFLAFSFGTFVSSTFESAGLSAVWATSTWGHLVLGLALIWLIFLLHYSGVRNYGRFLTVILTVVLLAAAITIVYGFATSQSVFLHAAAAKAPHLAGPPASQTPSLSSFISVITLFMFAYGGLTAASSLGGEARDAASTMPRGIFWGWLGALVLFSLVALALFHAVPWWSVTQLIRAGHPELATTPGLIGLVAPRALAVLVNFLVMIIVGKTVAPQMLDASRYLFAWGEDHLLPGAFLHTASTKAPDVALLTSGVLASLFLIEATIAGWQIGVLLRSVSLVLVFGMLGVGVLHLRFNRRMQEQVWVRGLVSAWWMVLVAILAIVVAIVLIGGVLVVPKTPFWLQPTVQGVITIAIGGIIYLLASRRAESQGLNVFAQAQRELPLE
jgi:amino acid transporter